MSTRNKDILVILLASIAVFVYKISGGSLSSWDEAYYAHLAKGLALADTWVKFIWGQADWMDKPLFQMWITAGFYKLFGVNEFATRLFPALSGVGVVLLAYVVAFRMFSRRVAIISSIMLMSTYHFLWIAKLGQLDVALTFFMFLSIWFFLRSEEKKIEILYSAFFFTVAFLTKGVGSFIIPMIIGVYVVFANKWGMLLNKYVLLGAAGFVGIAGGWFHMRGVLHGGYALA